jgi:hypothetical protein
VKGFSGKKRDDLVAHIAASKNEKAVAFLKDAGLISSKAAA